MNTATDPVIQAVLYDTRRPDRVLAPDELQQLAPRPEQLLWIDVDAATEEAAIRAMLPLAAQLGLRGVEPDAVRAESPGPFLRNHDEWFLVRAVAVESDGHARPAGRPLLLLCGRHTVFTVHAGPLGFLDALRAREQADSRIGNLGAESFAVSLLGWLVDGYLDAVSAFESEVDRLEVALLGNPRHRECLPDLTRMRRVASRLRRLLAPHRSVFGAMARPDFRPDADADVERHFRALEQRFERAMDAVENARDLLVGTFELYSTRSAERTNDTMRALTFVTVLLGTLAVFAGLLGMNFQAPLFETGARGFWSAVAGMGAFTFAGLALARWRRWI